MTVIKVKNKEGAEGYISVENWANPEISLMDFQDKDGNTSPEYREDLEYIITEEN